MMLVRAPSISRQAVCIIQVCLIVFVLTTDAIPNTRPMHAGNQALGFIQIEIPKEVHWPSKVRKPKYEIEIVLEDSEHSNFIYRSTHFEFQSNAKLSRKMVKIIARVFESTYLVIHRMPLPWQLNEPSDRYFKAQLWEHESEYHAAGGLAGSAGVYIPSKNLIMLPLSSMGVKKTSTRYTLDDDQMQLGVLRHEITHQITHGIRMPIWAIEGIAEYIRHIPYDDGDYRFGEDIEFDQLLLKSGYSGTYHCAPIQSLMRTSHEEWNHMLSSLNVSNQYDSAFFLTFYFLHLHGEKEALAYRKFMHQLRHNPNFERAEAILLNDLNFETLQEDMIKQYKRKGIELHF